MKNMNFKKSLFFQKLSIVDLNEANELQIVGGSDVQTGIVDTCTLSSIYQL